VKIEDKQMLPLPEVTAGGGQPLDWNISGGAVSRAVGANRGSLSASQKHQRKRMHDGIVYGNLFLLISQLI